MQKQLRQNEENRKLLNYHSQQNFKHDKYGNARRTKIKLNGEHIDEVNSFKYLGAIFSSDQVGSSALDSSKNNPCTIRCGEETSDYAMSVYV